jgi:hypothetical protein
VHGTIPELTSIYGLAYSLLEVYVAFEAQHCDTKHCSYVDYRYPGLEESSETNRKDRETYAAQDNGQKWPNQ